MPPPSLHIISFDVPEPPDYGGVIDIYHKIKSLYEGGCNIYLHCFEYGRGHSSLLDQYCAKIWYYKRATGPKGFSLSLPYIINSRRDKTLLDRLVQYDAPILFEGVHSTYYFNHPSLNGRHKILRTHNVEHKYYFQLYLKEKNSLKKIFFHLEAILLKTYECKLNSVDGFFELSIEDKEYFQNLYPLAFHEFVSPFHPFKTEGIPTGSGKFCLYHGNLSHPENIEAVRYLINNIIPGINVPFVIAGKDPSPRLTALVEKISHCTLVSNPSITEMDSLIRDAHIHVLPTFQESGMKLKLLYALFNGRHVVVNNRMLYGTGLESICNIANSPDEMRSSISNLMTKPFSESDKQVRAQALDLNYNNSANAERIITYLQQKSP